MTTHDNPPAPEGWRPEWQRRKEMRRAERLAKDPDGYPAARKRVPLGIRELARMHTPQAVAALVRCLKDNSTAVQAATVLLSYGFGRPAQNVTVRTISRIEDLSEEELRAIAGEGPTMIEGELAEDVPAADKTK